MNIFSMCTSENFQNKPNNFKRIFFEGVFMIIFEEFSFDQTQRKFNPLHQGNLVNFT